MYSFRFHEKNKIRQNRGIAKQNLRIFDSRISHGLTIYLLWIFFVYQTSEERFNKWTDRGQWNGFVCSLGNISQRAGQNDRNTQSAYLKVYQVKWGSGHTGNNEWTSPGLKKNIMWRETWKGLHKRDNSLHLNVWMKPLKLLIWNWLQSWMLFSEIRPCSAQQSNKCSFCKPLWNISYCPSTGHWSCMTFP